MSDWEQFLDEVSWFPETGAGAVVGEPGPWERAPVPGLPTLSALLASTTRTPVSVDGTSYELLAWGPPDERRGWLCHPPEDGQAPGNGAAVPEIQRSFWRVCGGIVEQFGGPSNWWENQDEILTAGAARQSLADALTGYAWIWQDEGLDIPIDPAEFYPVAVEANGNLTLARRDDGRLLLFAPDHAFDRVTPFAGSPPDSLLTLDDVPDLGTWIEVCAADWQQE